MNRRREEVKLVKLHEAQRDIGLAMKELSRVVLRCGRRFGKTTLLERMAVKTSVKGGKVGWFSPKYKLNLPSYKRILKMSYPQMASRSKIDQVIEMKKGGIVEFWTLEDEDAGRSRDYDLVIIDEGSLVESGLQDIWEQAISPTLLDRAGKAVMAGTPKGINPENYFYNACTDKNLGWHEFHAPTSKNPTLDPASVADLVNKYPKLVYLQEFLAEFVDWNGVAFFALESLLQDGKPVPWPSKTGEVFAVVDTASKDGMEHDGTAVTYFARDKFLDPYLTILDWEITQIEASLMTVWIPNVINRCKELAEQLRARGGSLGAFVEDKDSGIALNQTGRRLGLPITPIRSEITAIGKEGRAIAVSPHVFQGKVKISQYAFDKVMNFKQQTKNHFIEQICGFRMGQSRKEHKKDLLDTFTYGVAISCGNFKGF